MINIDMGGVCSDLSFSEENLELHITVDSEADVTVDEAICEFMNIYQGGVKKIYLDLPSDYSEFSFPEHLSKGIEEISVFSKSKLAHMSIGSIMRKSEKLRSINIPGSFPLEIQYLKNLESIVIRQSCHEELNFESLGKLGYLGIEIDHEKRNQPVIISSSLNFLNLSSDKKWTFDADKLHLPNLREFILSNAGDVKRGIDILKNVSVTPRLVSAQVKSKLGLPKK